MGHFATYTEKDLFNRVLECLGRAELGCAGGGDADRLAGAGIASFACWACLSDEDAETGNRDFVALLERHGDRFDHALDRAFGIRLGGAEHILNLADDICFVHKDFYC